MDQDAKDILQEPRRQNLISAEAKGKPRNDFAEPFRRNATKAILRRTGKHSVMRGER